MKFIDVKIDQRFKIIEFDTSRWTFKTKNCIKIAPVRTRSFKVYNAYCTTDKKYCFISPDYDCREFTGF